MAELIDPHTFMSDQERWTFLMSKDIFILRLIDEFSGVFNGGIVGELAKSFKPVELYVDGIPSRFSGSCILLWRI